MCSGRSYRSTDMQHDVFRSVLNIIKIRQKLRLCLQWDCIAWALDQIKPHQPVRSPSTNKLVWFNSLLVKKFHFKWSPNCLIFLLYCTQVHELGLRSNFQNDLSRTNYNSFDASQGEKYDADKMNAAALLSQKLLQKTLFRKKTAIFRVFALWMPNRWT